MIKLNDDEFAEERDALCFPLKGEDDPPHQADQTEDEAEKGKRAADFRDLSQSDDAEKFKQQQDETLVAVITSVFSSDFLLLFCHCLWLIHRFKLSGPAGKRKIRYIFILESATGFINVMNIIYFLMTKGNGPPAPGPAVPLPGDQVSGGRE